MELTAPRFAQAGNHRDAEARRRLRLKEKTTELRMLVGCQQTDQNSVMTQSINYIRGLVSWVASRLFQPNYGVSLLRICVESRGVLYVACSGFILPCFLVQSLDCSLM